MWIKDRPSQTHTETYVYIQQLLCQCSYVFKSAWYILVIITETNCECHLAENLVARPIDQGKTHKDSMVRHEYITIYNDSHPLNSIIIIMRRKLLFLCIEGFACVQCLDFGPENRAFCICNASKVWPLASKIMRSYLYRKLCCSLNGMLHIYQMYPYVFITVQSFAGLPPKQHTCKITWNS